MTDIIPKDDLDEDSIDLAASLSSGFVGMIPIIGPVVAELIKFSIPKQRMDRIVDFLRKLENKVDENIVRNMKTPDGMDLFVIASEQIIESKTEERREYIANLLKNSLNKEEIDLDEKKKLFSILNQLNDSEIIYLKSYSFQRTIGSTPPFIKRHLDILRPITKALNRSEEESRRTAFRDSYINNLEKLGLVTMESRRIDNREPTGVTPLGKLLLDYIEVPDE